MAEIDPALKDTNDSPNAPTYDALRALPPEEFAAKIEAFVPVWVEGIVIDFEGQRSLPVFESAAVPEVGDLAAQRLSTVVLRGTLRVDHRDGSLEVHAGQAVIVHAGEWVRYSTPGHDGAEYIAICLPAFSPETVHRDA